MMYHARNHRTGLLIKEIQANVDAGNHERVEELLHSESLRDKKRLEILLSYGDRSLSADASMQRAKNVKTLLFYDVPLDLPEVCRWYSYMKHNKQDIIQEFLNHGWDIETKLFGGLPLMCWTSYEGDPDLLPWFLEHGADPNAERANPNPEQDNHNAFIPRRVSPYCSPMVQASTVGSLRDMEILLLNGAFLDSGLLFAVMTHEWTARRNPDDIYRKTLEKMIFLLENGVDVNEAANPDRLYGRRPYYLESPLHCAVGLRNEDYVQFLLENGAKREAERFGEFTPAALALEKGYMDIYELISSWR